uniref:Uncharacterized protein n=1 Tax=Plectus sambesii TaxID=2011161 RepID=A0A914VKV2_9BILA
MKLLLVLVTPFVVAFVQPLPLRRRSDSLPEVGPLFADLLRINEHVDKLTLRKLNDTSSQSTVAPHWEELRELTGLVQKILESNLKKNLNFVKFIMQQSRLMTTTTTTATTTDSSIDINLLR